MESQLTRFVVEKNAAEYLAKNPGSAKHPVPDGVFSGSPAIPAREFADPDYAKYDLVNAERFAAVAKQYPDLSGFLRDIEWASVFRSAEAIVQTMLGELAEEAGKTEASIVVAECHPLAMVATDRILRFLGYRNVALSFKRPYFVNSANKGFEAALFLAAEGAEFAQMLVRDSGESVRAAGFALGDPSLRYFLLTEEASLEDTSAPLIDPYFKTQVGYKETVPTYRVERFPEKPFLAAKNVRKAFLFDTDRTPGRDFQEYVEDFRDAGVVKAATVRLGKFPKNVSAYDEYLVSKGSEFRRYREGLADKAREAADRSAPVGGTGYSKRAAPSNAVSSSSDGRELVVRPYLYGVPLIMLLFLMTDTGAWGGLPRSASTSTGWHGWSSGGSSSSWSSGGSSYSSSSKSSSSSIRSFGGGGFSKGGG